MKKYLIATALTIALHELGHLLIGDFPSIDVAFYYEFITLIILILIPSVYVLKEVV